MVGFGINTTTDICGIVGSGVQFDYTVIGGIKIIIFIFRLKQCYSKTATANKIIWYPDTRR